MNNERISNKKLIEFYKSLIVWEDTKLRGRVFELFSEYLLRNNLCTLLTKKDKVYLVSNYLPEHIKNMLLRNGNIDNGVDVIIQHPDKSYSLVQCKCVKKLKKMGNEIFDIANEMTLKGKVVKNIILTTSAATLSERWRNQPGRIVYDHYDILRALKLHGNYIFKKNQELYGYIKEFIDNCDMSVCSSSSDESGLNSDKELESNDKETLINPDVLLPVPEIDEYKENIDILNKKIITIAIIAFIVLMSINVLCFLFILVIVFILQYIMG